MPTLTAGENLVNGNACYIASTGKAWKAKADSVSTMPARVLAAASINADASGSFHKFGPVTLTSHGLGDANDTLYVSPSTAGLLTTTLPTGSGNQVQLVGWIMDANTIFWNPNDMLIEVP